MASVTVTEQLPVNQIAVTTDNPVTSITVADATSIYQVAVTETGTDITVVLSTDAAGVSSLNGLTGTVTLQAAATLQGSLEVPGSLVSGTFLQGEVADPGTFASYAENPVFHGYNLTIGGTDSGDNRQGITFTSSTPNGNAYMVYNDLTDKIEQSRDGTNYYALPISTTELAEGTNLYYTEERVDARVSAGISNIDYPVDSVNGKTNTVVLTTTDIAEGTNLYYTTQRFDDGLATKTTTNLAEGTNLYYTTQRFDDGLATKTTDNLNEGSLNKYFTTTRARESIQVVDTGGDGSLSYDNSTGNITYTGPTASEVRAHFTAGTGVSITDGSIAIGQAVGTTSNVTFQDGVFNGNLTVNGTTTYVNTTDLNIKDKTITIAYGQTGTPTQNAGVIVDRGALTDSELRWNESTDKWEQVRAGVATVLPVSTLELAENTNLYYTAQRFDDRLATKTTDNLAEGSTNRYYLDSRARTAISVTDTGGDGSLSYDNSSGVITYTGPTATNYRAAISVTDTGGDGGLSYDNSTGVITYTGPSASEVRAHFSGGTGVTITDGVVAIGQPVATTSDVIFRTVDVARSISAGDAPLALDGSASAPTLLAADGTSATAVPVLGVRTENVTSGFGAAKIIVDHGQNRSGGTGTTGGNPVVILESTRGTALAQTATSTADVLGLIGLSGHDGVRGLGTGVNGSSVQLLGVAGQPFLNNGTYTTQAGATTILRSQPHNLRLTSVSRQAILTATYVGGTTNTPPTQNLFFNSTSMATQYDAAGNAIQGHGRQDVQFFHPTISLYGVPSQSTANADNSTLPGSNVLTFYSSRQSGWSGRRDIVENNDTLAQIRAFGQTTNNSTGLGSQAGTIEFTAAETFSTTLRGSRFNVQTGRIGTNILENRITVDSNSGTIKTTRLVQSSPYAQGGEISMKSGVLNGATDYEKSTELSVTALTTDGSRNATYETKTNRFDGTNYSPTQSGDLLGRFTFLGNYGASTTPLVNNAAGYITVTAAETFSSTASGATISLNANKIGSNETQVVFSANSSSAHIQSDVIRLNSSTNSVYMEISNTKILNNRPHRSAITTHTMARGSTYTPAVGVNNFIEIELTAGTDPTYIDVDNLTVLGEGGHQAILVYNNSGSSVGNGDLVIRNNGTAINSTQDTIANGGRVIFTVYCVGNYASCEYMVAH
jgi:hypothetical protein